MTDSANEETRTSQRPYRGQAAPCDESPTVPILDRWREAKGRTAIPLANDDTRRLPKLPAQRDRERMGTLNWGRERVGELLDGNGPVPHGFDPDALAAARRIARYLKQRRWR